MASQIANAPMHVPPQLRDTNYSHGGHSHSHEPPRQFSSSSKSLIALAPSSPVCETADRHTDELIYALIEERPGFMLFLERLGFNYDTSVSILRYWITLKLRAPAGGPYDLFGTALAVIAELDEPRMPVCRDCINVRTTHNKSCKLDWFLAFSEILNDRALASLRQAGIHRAQSFGQVKWIVYRMMLACGNEGWE